MHCLSVYFESASAGAADAAAFVMLLTVNQRVICMLDIVSALTWPMLLPFRLVFVCTRAVHLLVGDRRRVCRTVSSSSSSSSRFLVISCVTFVISPRRISRRHLVYVNSCLSTHAAMPCDAETFIVVERGHLNGVRSMPFLLRDFDAVLKFS